MKNENLKIIFFGTPEYSIIILEKLFENFEISAIITNPGSPVEKFAKNHKISVISSLGIDEPQTEIKTLKPDLGVVTAFGKIISSEILKIPKYGALNIHPSLLPQYRGPSPVQYAILKGDKFTGVTIIKMDEKLDHGPILATEKEKILNTDTTRTLSERVFTKGAKLLTKILPDYISGKIKPKAQDHKKATFTKLIKKEDGLLNPKDPPEILERKVRAFLPWPTLYTFFNKKRIIIHQAHLEKGKFVPDFVQIEGKKKISYQDFIRGYHTELKF